jgi:hypothetical protein
MSIAQALSCTVSYRIGAKLGMGVVATHANAWLQELRDSMAWQPCCLHLREIRRKPGRRMVRLGQDQDCHGMLCAKRS